MSHDATVSNEPCTAALVVADHVVGVKNSPFSVTPGVPLSASFETLSLLLGSANACVEQIAATLNNDLGWLVFRQIEQAQALLEGMRVGYLQSRGAP